MKRNTGNCRTEDARNSIIEAMIAAGCTSRRATMPKAAIGRAAFPGYNFRKPQGAAFAVAKIVKDMEREGLLSHYMDDYTAGYYYTGPIRDAKRNEETP